MTHRYRIVPPSEDRRREKDEKSRREKDLAFVAAEVVSMKLKIKMPTVRFIIESGDGCISFDQRIDGYSPPGGKEIFLRAGMAPARVVETTLHEVRHCSQWLKGWAGRTNQHCEADAQTWTREFWATRRAETDPEKILPQLCEIGAPLAMAAGNEQAAEFYVAELKATGHPAAARLDKQYVEWCRIRERAESPRKLCTVNNLPLGSAAEVKGYYYRIALPKIAATYIKPHLQASRVEYSIGGLPR